MIIIKYGSMFSTERPCPDLFKTIMRLNNRMHFGGVQIG